MDSTFWCICVPLLLLLLIVFLEEKKKKKKAMQRFILKTKAQRKKGGSEMNEVIKRFIGKDCIIATMNGNIMGVVEAMEGNWIIVAPAEEGASPEIVCVDYISRIREYPKNKNGKRKAIVN